MLASEHIELDVVPSGILALDYVLGTGGWPRGHPVEVYGKNDIGKSSLVGLSALRNAQAQGLLCGYIAVEPGFDEIWAERHGVDNDRLLIVRPDDAEDAFSVLSDWVHGDVIDFIVFDSIGALIQESETGPEGKMKMGGVSSLATWGAKNILMPTWKNNKGVILLNQVRHDMNARIPGQMKPFGAEAMRHLCAMRVELKQAGTPYKVGSGEAVEEIGRKMVAVVHRNKLNEGSKQRAEFDFYHKETADHPLGVDVGKDVVNTAIRTRVFEGSGYFTHRTFPGQKHQIHGREAVEKFVLDNPEVIAAIREDVLSAMLERQANRGKKVVNEAPEGSDDGE